MLLNLKLFVVFFLYFILLKPWHLVFLHALMYWISHSVEPKTDQKCKCAPMCAYTSTQIELFSWRNWQTNLFYRIWTRIEDTSVAIRTSKLIKVPIQYDVCIKFDKPKFRLLNNRWMKKVPIKLNCLDPLTRRTRTQQTAFNFFFFFASIFFKNIIENEAALKKKWGKKMLNPKTSLFICFQFSSSIVCYKHFSNNKNTSFNEMVTFLRYFLRSKSP